MMMKSRKKVISLILCMMMIFSVSGCQLAKEGEDPKNGVASKDTFVGVYVTYRKENDPYDMVTYKGEAEDSEGKVYAKLLEKEEDGITFHEYVFEDVKGIACFEALVLPQGDDTAGYRNSIIGEGVLGAHVQSNTHILESDQGEEVTNTVEIEGSIYFTEEVIVYVNYVFQEEDGDVYFVKDGMGVFISDGVASNGTHKIEDNGSVVKLNIGYKKDAGKVEFVSISEDNEVLQISSYSPSEIPENINVEPGTEYLIVKTIYPEGEPVITTLTRENQWVDLAVGDNGELLAGHTVWLTWGEE